MKKNNPRSRPGVIIIVGPTASGKSGEALLLAKEMDGVIINADSMQVYDALPLLTACPTEEDMNLAPHRLYRFLAPSRKCTAAFWRNLALEEIETAIDQKKMPIVVGGTGFYLKVLLEGLSPVPDISQETREKTTGLMKEMGNKAFHEMLAARDPEMAGRLHVNDSQRLQRAYEVLEDTGKSLAYWQSLPKETPPDYFDFEIRKIIPEKKALKSNIDRRFDIMLEQGALEEVGELMDRIHRGAVPADAPVTGALGYQHLASCLRGEIPVEEACWLAKTQTRQYAKRQITWLRNQLKTS